MAITTFSGHRNAPGQKGLRINSATYAEIDNVFGPSSWTVVWKVKDGEVFVFLPEDNKNSLNIGNIDSPILENGRTIREVLLDDLNIVANLGEPMMRGFLVSAVTVKNKNMAAVYPYIKNMDIKIEYLDNSLVRGWHGIKISLNNKRYFKYFSWPWTEDPGFRVIMDSIKKLVDINTLQLITTTI